MWSSRSSASPVRFVAQQDVHPRNVGVIGQHHREQDLPHEAGCAGQQNGPSGKLLVDGEHAHAA